MQRQSLLRSFLASGFVLSMVVGAIACSSDSAQSDAEKFAAALCQEYMQCCAKAGLPSGGGFCQMMLGAGNVDAAAGEKCLADVRAINKKPTFCSEVFSIPSCSNVITPASNGTKKPGEVCSNDSDCAPSAEGKVACASVTPASGPKIEKCQVQVAGKAGDSPCVGTVDGVVTWGVPSSDSDVLPRAYLCNVKDGVRCDAMTRKCTAIPKLGDACDSSSFEPCMKDAYCDSGTKTCTARKPLGASCDSFASEQCVAGAYCKSATNTCTASLADGAACTSDEECDSRNCDADKCKPTLDLGLIFICAG